MGVKELGVLNQNPHSFYRLLNLLAFHEYL